MDRQCSNQTKPQWRRRQHGHFKPEEYQDAYWQQGRVVVVLTRVDNTNTFARQGISDCVALTIFIGLCIVVLVVVGLVAGLSGNKARAQSSNRYRPELPVERGKVLMQLYPVRISSRK